MTSSGTTFTLHELLGRASTRPTAEPEWDADLSPAAPWPLVEAWLRSAVDDDVLAAQTAVLATSTADGTPSARTVLLSDITEDGFWFATSAAGPTGTDLAENPAASLVLHLRDHARQIRVSGTAARGDQDRSAAAFRARGKSAQAVTLAGEQSSSLPADAAERIDRARQRLEQDDSVVDPDWIAYVVAPISVEFWQSRHGSGEQRLRYRRTGAGWTAERLWP